mmetsp:Transcript_2341/g.4322  ORF Transcript_2341/g.4322 Transcript_2341/m.4322 type:complete len:190 (-) Transcript_2341:674-1243(-)
MTTIPLTTTAADVVIVGAGAAGLTAAYHLNQAGWSSVQILEANSQRFGGRLLSVEQRQQQWEFPVDLGAEWIHGPPAMILEDILGYPVADIINNKTVLHEYEITVYDYGDMYQWGDSQGMEDYKWVGGSSSWYIFFRDYVVSTLKSCKTTTLPLYHNYPPSIEMQFGNLKWSLPSRCFWNSPNRFILRI